MYIQCIERKEWKEWPSDRNEISNDSRRNSTCQCLRLIWWALKSIRVQMHKSGVQKKVGLSWTVVNGELLLNREKMCFFWEKIDLFWYRLFRNFEHTITFTLVPRGWLCCFVTKRNLIVNGHFISVFTLHIDRLRSYFYRNTGRKWSAWNTLKYDLKTAMITMQAR